MEKEYVFHGSPIKIDKLVPNQACDMEYKEGCQYAVYATTSKIMAILFSMGCIEAGNNAERIMMPEYGEKMVFRNCHPNYNGKGYVYYLDKSKFVHTMGSQWVCFDEIVPDFVEAIEVNDYLDYCIIENDKLSESETKLKIILQDDEIQISIDDKDVGIIKTYMNPYHTEHCYLELQMKQYDVIIAKELFKQIHQRLGKPMQVMISSDNKVIVEFIRAAGFVCKRKCYEINASASDYVGQIIQGKLECAVIGDDIYENCCEVMLDRYILMHRDVSPWTGTKADFVQSLPEMVYYEMQDGQIANVVFVEENEIAYVSGIERESFYAFTQVLISKLLEQSGSITFEADDCDTYAMDLKALFVNQSEERFDTYIY